MMTLPSPTLTSPDKSPGYQLDNDTTRRIDTICSQLANRGQGHHGGDIKQEPTSPGGTGFSSNASPHQYPSNPISPRDSQPSHGSPSSSINNLSPVGFPSQPPFRSQSQQRLPPFSSALPRSVSTPAEGEHSLPSMTYSGKDMSHGNLDSQAGKFYSGPNPRFLPPTRRANSMSNINPVVGLRHRGTTPEHVRSIADSTSNLSEFFSTLQGLVQKSQEIPELNINISKPKVW